VPSVHEHRFAIVPTLITSKSIHYAFVHRPPICIQSKNYSLETAPALYTYWFANVHVKRHALVYRSPIYTAK